MNMRLIVSSLVGAFVLTLGLMQSSPAALAQDYKAVLAAPDRSDADRENDKKRNALELLSFTGPKTGWRVVDMGAGGGYSTELMARAVGPTGKVWGQSDKASDRFTSRTKAPNLAHMQPLVRPYDQALAPDYGNLDLITFWGS